MTRAVLVLNGNQRSALATTRSLGRRGVPVYVGDEATASLAGRSRFCAGTVRYPSPLADPHGFVAAVTAAVRRHGIGVLLPMTELATSVVLAHRHAFPDVALPYPGHDAFMAVSDKWSLFTLARRLGIATPETHLAKDRQDLLEAVDALGGPVVLKPVRSVPGGPGEPLPGVRYAASPAALRRELAEGHDISHFPLLVQTRVEGQGQGVFALYEAGHPRAFFAHRRLREKPPSGGVSVLSESVPVDPDMRAMLVRLLDALGWHGVAMGEFKVTADGRPYLLEVNGRFWGSLQLAIDAGVDFPWLLYRVACGEPADWPAGYTAGRRCRWLLGDLDHLYLRLRAAAPRADKWAAVRAFCAPGGRATRHEVDRLDDLGPFLHELRGYVGSALR